MNPWIEATRPRTLPVSMSPVLVGGALAAGDFHIIPFTLCLAFAILAQIASNFANEYYDWRDGLDRPGRDGFRRGVTEGDISPAGMKHATFTTLALASAVGLSLLIFGPPWIIAVGIVIAFGALGYSAGPYPFSRHALGEIAVLIFFGIVPVCFTYLMTTGNIYDLQSINNGCTIFMASISIGLLSSNILIVNNIRDINDDIAAGKQTIAVKFGRRRVSLLYLLNGVAAMLLLIPLWECLGIISIAIPLIFIILHIILYNKLTTENGSSLNPVLGKTAMLLFVLSIAIFTTCMMQQ